MQYWELLIQLEIYKSKFQKFAYLRELSKCQNSGHFFKIHKNKKIARREWSEEDVCKI